MMFEIKAIIIVRSKNFVDKDVFFIALVLISFAKILFSSNCNISISWEIIKPTFGIDTMISSISVNDVNVFLKMLIY